MLVCRQCFPALCYFESWKPTKCACDRCRVVTDCFCVSARCVYDNPATNEREVWEDGVFIARWSANGLPVDESQRCYFGNCPWEPNVLRGDPEAMGEEEIACEFEEWRNLRTALDATDCDIKRGGAE